MSKPWNNKKEKWEILRGIICPYCKKPTKIAKQIEVYGTEKYGTELVRVCWECDAWVGCHAGTNKAKGRLANKELRGLKIQAHAYFDPLWKMHMKRYNYDQNKSRNMTYEWLADEMGLDREECHIGMFNENQCKRVIEICSQYANKRTKTSNAGNN